VYVRSTSVESLSLFCVHVTNYECQVTVTAGNDLVLQSRQAIGLPTLRSAFAKRVFLFCSSKFLPLISGRTLRVFENRVLRKIFGPKRQDVTAD
jgi:hypothetical protein